MKKINALSNIVPVLAVSLLLPAFVGAADPMSGSPSAGSATQGTTPGSANQPTSAPAAAAPTPASTAELPTNWTKVKGTVQEVNVMDHQVKIQDEKGALSQVTVGTDVTIRKEGKTVALSQLQMGDQITLTRKKSAAAQSNKG